jgi:hypothetical protein
MPHETPKQFPRPTAEEMARSYAPVAMHEPGMDFAGLGKRTQQRLDQLTYRKDDRHRLLPDLETRQHANSARAECARLIERMLLPRVHGGHGFNEDSPQVLQEQARLARLTAEAARLQTQYEVRGQEYTAASQVLSAALSFLRNAPPGTLVDDDNVPTPALNGKVGLLDQLEHARHRGRTLAADLHAIRSSPWPSAHAKAKARTEVEALAQHGAISVSHLIEANGSLVFPVMRVSSQLFNVQPVEGARGAIAFANDLPNTLAILAWVHRDAVIAAVNRAIDEEADDKSALGDSERRKREQQVLADILQNDRLEAAICWAAIDAQLPCEHRLGCTPAAVLQCRTVKAPAKPTL